MIKEVIEAEILPKSLYDHNPLRMKFIKRWKNLNWRMNIFDLDQEDFKENLKKELKEFFILNNTEGMERKIIWDASKAFIRGLAIQQRKES